jgi:mono/diheme cytochrome c family protein
MRTHKNHCLAGLLILAISVTVAYGQSTNGAASAPVYVPDYSHAADILPAGIIAWDGTQKTIDATNGQELVHFVFDLTNTSPNPVTILEGRGSCSCTTVQMPPTPWTLPVGGTGKIGVAIDLTGKIGTLFKQAVIVTDKGMQNLMLRVNILPPVLPSTSPEMRAKGVAVAKVNRQAVFQGECATCHLPNVADKYGVDLYTAVCAVCHEANPRASMVPDLHHLKDPTSEEFWRAWITAGKPGTLMPAFATSQGGPLTDPQIETLAAYLATVIPSSAAAPVVH